MYRIDLKDSTMKLVPCTLKPSVQSGKTICVNEDGGTLVVLPDGTERPGADEPAGSPNWDSEWTRADDFGDTIIYRSSGGIPRGYRVYR